MTTRGSASHAARPQLIGGLAFMEGVLAGGPCRETLTSWLQTHLVTPGRMVSPPVIVEPGAGAIAMRGRASDEQVVAAVLQLAYARVVAALRGMVGRPADQSFLVAAIHSDRVRRVIVAGEPRWVARPSIGDRLSDIVLSLFAADALEHREEYDTRLSVCDVCGRVGFDGATSLRRCPAHASSSGARVATTLRDLPAAGRREGKRVTGRPASLHPVSARSRALAAPGPRRWKWSSAGTRRPRG